MASDEQLQRSVQLLDEAVGSPTLYTSPRFRQRRSSLFTNTALYKFRRSDVQRFAMETSLSMSPSELEMFMDSSTSALPATSQHTIVEKPSDNLFQAFLETMQAHNSAREVFDTIAEFVQNCNNTLDVVREAQDEKEIGWLELERNTWRLVQCLYQHRLASVEVDGAEGDENMAVDVVRPPSEKEIMENFYKTNPRITEHQLVIDWLEKNAADIADESQGPKLHHYMDNTVAWENTLHQLQNKSVAYGSSRPIVDKLDPDAPMRLSKPLHDLDMEDEARLLKQVFTEIRCGRHREALAACHHCGQAWRAASLEGWRLYHDPNYTATSAGTVQEKQPVEGNPHRDIWKLCAWRLADNIRAGKYARAIYGAYCGHLGALLGVCETWQDVLWAHTRVLVDHLVEQEVRDNSLREYTSLPDSYWDHKLSMEEIFAALDSSADPVVRKQARSRECSLQKLLILGRLPQLMEEMLSWAREDSSPQTLRFLAHLTLTLRLLGQPTEQQLADEIVKIYVKVLMKQQEAVQVAFYVATLPPDDQVTLYAEFLQHIDQSEQRKAALDAAEAVNLPVEAITQRVVENIRNEETLDRKAHLQLSAELTEEDRRKISALEWVVLYPSQRAEALWQTNALVRTFLGLGKLQSARLAFNQIPPDSIDQVLNQYQGDDDTASIYSDFLPARVSAAIQEYMSHKAYLDAQEGFADWFSHYHHARPTEPSNPGHSATFTERMAHDYRMAAYRKELDRWQASMDHQTKCVKKQLYNVLLFPRGGWLADNDPEDRLRAHQMKSLRTLCIPKIVLLLHTVLHSMALYKEAIQLGDLVVDEQHHLYKVYSKQQIRELLSKVRESSIASLAQGKDSWGHSVSS